MTDLIKIVQQSFENIKISDETGFEFWSARDLMNVLGYKEWRKFDGIIEKAKISCKNSGQKPENHFVGGDKMINLGKGGKRNISNYLLTRYTCYLVAQNGDSRKTEISFAQTYFASQTRKQEISELENQVDTMSLNIIKDIYTENKTYIDKSKSKIKTLDFNTGKDTDIFYTKAKIIDMYGFMTGLNNYLQLKNAKPTKNPPR